EQRPEKRSFWRVDAWRSNRSNLAESCQLLVVCDLFAKSLLRLRLAAPTILRARKARYKGSPERVSGEKRLRIRKAPEGRHFNLLTSRLCRPYGARHLPPYLPPSGVG